MRFRCNMPTCGIFPRGFVFAGNKGICPRCGERGGALVDVHLMVFHPDGPIQGRNGRRQLVACQRKRDRLASPIDFFSATDQVRAVTCPGCRSTRDFAQAVALSGFEDDDLLPEASPAVIVDLGAKPR